MKSRIYSIMLTIALLIVFGVSSALADSPLKLIYYDGHMHTWRQDGTGGVADIKATAQSRSLDAVIITDHCKGLDQKKWASLIDDCIKASNTKFLALPAFEVTGEDGMFNRTHVNALFVADPFVGKDKDCLCPEEVWPSPENPNGNGALIPGNVTEWVEYIHSQGGIAVHNHPSGSTRLDYGVDNLELYNQGHVDDVISYALQLGYPPAQAWQFGILLNNLAINGEDPALNQLMPNPFYGIPGFPQVLYLPMRYILFYATYAFSGTGQWLGEPEAPLTSWDELLLAYVDGVVDKPIFGLANSDAHNTGNVDCPNPNVPCSTVGVAKNGAYVHALNAKELYNAIKSGKTFATTGPSLFLDVNGKLMGETAYIANGGTASINLSVDSEDPNFKLVNIIIIKNCDSGSSSLPLVIPPNSSNYDDTVDDTVTEDGYYRVEVTSMDSSGALQFAWSNPVFVRIQ